ncbi:unnamed protein product, partial [Didymodactylos carnosus]
MLSRTRLSREKNLWAFLLRPVCP